MSHYAVAVIHRPEQSVEKLLAPYSEDLEVEPYIYKTKSEAVMDVRNNYDAYKDKSDDECWERYVDGWGIEKNEIDADGNILTTYNPESKWDWWTYGGRFADMLKSKTDNQCYDSLPIKDIDFSPDKKIYKESIEFWENLLENDLSEEEKPFTIYKDEYYINRYKNKETYAEKMSAFTTYAVVTPDGKWNSAGEMGWFGISSESDDEYMDWEDHWYERFVEPYKNNDYIMTIVDCHI